MEELGTVEDLERFFAEFDGKARRCSFGGVEFELERRRMPGTMGVGGAVVGLAAGGFAGLAAGAPRTPPGLYVTVTLPVAIRSDLLLRTSDRPEAGKESLDACFGIDASDRSALDEYMGKGLGETLIRLNRRYVIELDSERLILGPFEAGPADFAADVVELIAALPRPSPDEPVVPDFDEAAERDGDVVEVAQRSGPVAAELALAALAAAGIPSRTIGAGGGVFGAAFDAVVRLVVPASFAERAMEVLREAEDLEASEGDEDDEEDGEGDEGGGGADDDDGDDR